MSKEAALNTTRIADMLQRQQPVEVYKLAALCPCQAPRVTYSFTEQEHASTGGRSSEPVSRPSKISPMLAEKLPDVCEFETSLVG